MKASALMSKWSGAVLVALLAGSLCAPARAELQFVGRRREHENGLSAVYATLPARGKEVNVSVEEVPASEWDRREEIDEPDAVGMYDEETHQLLLKGGEDDLELTFAHEFGHHVFSVSFSDAERRTWRRFWRMHRGEMPEGDAEEDPEEGFAECYAGTYYQGPRPWRLAPTIKEEIRTFFKPAVPAVPAVPTAPSAPSESASKSPGD
jgi:hypothetical protein